ncbi:hypothetical protein GCK32_006805, partial [Trichostrongylus colubriformis]
FTIPELFSPAALTVDRLLKSSTSDGPSTESDEAQSHRVPDIAYVKLSAMIGKTSPKKRLYFNEVQSSDESPSKKPVHDVKRIGMKYQDSSLTVLDKSSREGQPNDNLGDHSEERTEMLMEPTIDVDSYEEVAVNEEYDDGAEAVSSSFLTSEGREMIAGNTFRELKGENNYLKEQLQASMLRVKQLEAVLMQRNGQVKKLVSENLQLSMKCRKLMGALAEDEIREALS